jgi:hypothetical protein
MQDLTFLTSAVRRAGCGALQPASDSPGRDRMGFMTVDQVSQLVRLADHGTSVRLFFEAENGLLERPIPFQGRVGMLGLILRKAEQEHAQRGK